MLKFLCDEQSADKRAILYADRSCLKIGRASDEGRLQHTLYQL